MEKPWDPKDPDEIKDYSFSWAKQMFQDKDTIAASEWVIVSGEGLIIDTRESFFDADTSQTSFWASAGTDGADYKLKNHITTVGGRAYERTRTLKVKTL